MVDVGLLQSVSTIAGAIGVCVAAAYYVTNLRHAKKAKEMDLALIFATNMCSPAGMERFAKVMDMKWENHKDFMEKYGYSNPKMFGNWVSMCLAFEMLGHLLKSKLTSPETLYSLGAYGCIPMWDKYKEVVQSRRALAFGKKYLVNFEFLAGELAKIQKRDEPSFEGVWWKRTEQGLKP